MTEKLLDLIDACQNTGSKVDFDALRQAVTKLTKVPGLNKLLSGKLVSMDVSKNESDATHRVFGRISEVVLKSCGAREDTILAIEESRNFAEPVNRVLADALERLLTWPNPHGTIEKAYIPPWLAADCRKAIAQAQAENTRLWQERETPIKEAAFFASEANKLEIERDQLRARLSELESEATYLSQFKDTLDDAEEAMFFRIERAARVSFRRWRSSVGGNQVHRGDSYDAHLVWATQQEMKQQPVEPVNQMLLGASKKCADYLTGRQGLMTAGKQVEGDGA